MKVLFHVCCAPCAMYPLKKLREKKIEVACFFYNPNIHPFIEFESRRRAIEEYLRVAGIEVIIPDYVPAEFFQAINTKEDKPRRCPVCWKLRLTQTAEVAKEKGFDGFSTTLLVSPYQDQACLKEIGADLEEELKVAFYYEDFRVGFRQAHAEAKAQGIYCQRYCGCIYSEVERYKKNKD